MDQDLKFKTLVDAINAGSKRLSALEQRIVRADTSTPQPSDDKFTEFAAVMAKVAEGVAAIGERLDELMEKNARKGDDERDGESSPEPMVSDDDRGNRCDADEEMRLLEAQHRADNVCYYWGRERIRPRVGETVRSFLQRTGTIFKRYSPSYTGSDLSLIRDDAALAAAVETIFEDAKRASTSNETTSGLQRTITRTDPFSGQRIIEHFGPIGAINGTLAPFRLPAYRVKRINKNPDAA